MQQQQDSTMKFRDQQTVAVRPFDIICGKKDVKYTHPGNLFYCQVILENRDEYQRTTDRQIKKRIIWSVLGQIRSHGGRFIKVQSSSASQIVELCDAEAYMKVGQALRMSGMKKTPHTTKLISTMEESNNNDHHHEACQVEGFDYGNKTYIPTSNSAFEVSQDQNDESQINYSTLVGSTEKGFVDSSSLDELLMVQSTNDYPDYPNGILDHHEINMEDDFELMTLLEDLSGKIINGLDDLDA